MKVGLTYLFWIFSCIISILCNAHDNIKSVDSLLQVYLVNGAPIIYRLNPNGYFKKESTNKFPPGYHTFTVLPSGILKREKSLRRIEGSKAIKYMVSNYTDNIIPVYNADRAPKGRRALYVLSITDDLVPVTPYYSNGFLSLAFQDHILFAMEASKDLAEKMTAPVRMTQSPPIFPDISCNGDIVLFLLQKNGTLKRQPPDEYLPKGVRLKYQLNGDLFLIPIYDYCDSCKQSFSYFTGEDGNLIPNTASNGYILRTSKEGTSFCFMLLKNGVIAPVTEKYISQNNSVNYYFQQQFIHTSSQFKQVFSNSSALVVIDKVHGEKDRDEGYSMNRKKRNVDCILYDDSEKRIFLCPFVSGDGSVVLYELTSQGTLERLDSYNEPEFGFNVTFKLLERCVLVPVRKKSSGLFLSYTLLKNGNLMPNNEETNTLTKAPASFMYFLLGTNRELIPVRVKILPSNEIELYFHECLIYRIPSEVGQNLKIFTTFYSPLFANVNGKLLMSYNDPLTRKKISGSTWWDPEKSYDEPEPPANDLYLVCQNSTKIPIKPDLGENKEPVIFDLDYFGVFHRSPKHDNNSLGLKNYKMACKGVLIPSNERSGYIYMVDKLGNMFPYYYPSSEMRTPFKLTVKYVLCEGEILLPITIEVTADCVCYLFEGKVIYKTKVWPLNNILEELEEDEEWNELEAKELSMIVPFKDTNGSVVLYVKDYDVLKRFPKENIESFLVGTTGSFQLQSTGSLILTSPQEPKDNIINLSIEEVGDLRVDSDNVKKPTAKYYILGDKGDLMAVKARKRNGYLKLYKSCVQIAKVALTDISIDEIKDTTEKSDTNGPYYISLPIKGANVTSKTNSPEDQEKCEEIKRTLEEIISKDPGLMHVEMEITNEMVNQMLELSKNCSKRSRKEISNKIEETMRRRIIRPKEWEEEGDELLLTRDSV